MLTMFSLVIVAKQTRNIFIYHTESCFWIVQYTVTVISKYKHCVSHDLRDINKVAVLQVIKICKPSHHISSQGYFATCLIAKNTIISPDFLVRKFWGKAQFPHSFGRIARNYAETVPFHKISKLRNQVKLRYFMQCYSQVKLKQIPETQIRDPIFGI